MSEELRFVDDRETALCSQPPRNPTEDEFRFRDIVDSKKAGLLGLHFSDEEVIGYLSDLVNYGESQTLSEARRHKPSFLQKVIKLGKEALRGFKDSGGGTSIKA